MNLLARCFILLQFIFLFYVMIFPVHPNVQRLIVSVFSRLMSHVSRPPAKSNPDCFSRTHGAYGLWPMAHGFGSPLPAKRIQTAAAAINHCLRHGAYSLWPMAHGFGSPLPAKRIQTAEPPEPFAFIRNQCLVSSLNPLCFVGPAARQYLCNLCNLCNLWFN